MARLDSSGSGKITRTISRNNNLKSYYYTSVGNILLKWTMHTILLYFIAVKFQIGPCIIRDITLLDKQAN